MLPTLCIYVQQHFIFQLVDYIHLPYYSCLFICLPMCLSPLFKHYWFSIEHELSRWPTQPIRMEAARRITFGHDSTWIDSTPTRFNRINWLWCRCVFALIDFCFSEPWMLVWCILICSRFVHFHYLNDEKTNDEREHFVYYWKEWNENEQTNEATNLHLCLPVVDRRSRRPFIFSFVCLIVFCTAWSPKCAY